MKRLQFTAVAAVALMVSLSGCMPSDRSDAPTQAPTTGEAEVMKDELPWNKAKAQALATQREIADLIPEERVAKINHKKTGTLLSCGGNQINWNGSTTVTLTEGIEEEPIVKAIEAHYQDGRFNIKTSLDVVGDYRIQLRSPDTSENYIIVKDGPGEVSIDSGSACFILPENVDLDDDF